MEFELEELSTPPCSALQAGEAGDHELAVDGVHDLVRLGVVGSIGRLRFFDAQALEAAAPAAHVA